MQEKIVTLTIEKIAGLGDGVGLANGRRVFVPYTVQGDTVRARITRSTKDADYGEVEEIITPGAGRIAPVCGHFAECGGCALQHVNDVTYAGFKQQTAREAVRKAGFDPACVLPLVRLPANSRRRVEIKIADGKFGYYAEHSHRLVDIEECRVLEPALEALVLRLKPRLAGSGTVQINGVDGGYDILLSEGVLWPDISDDAILRVSAKKGEKLATLVQCGAVTVTLGGIAVEVPPGAFLQASREAQAIMVQHVLAATGDAKKILDLFAGIGTYSFPLAVHAEVTAIEGDAAMVEAMKATAKRHGLGAKLKAVRRDLFRDPVERFDGVDAIVINPPRTGAAAQAEKLARSRVGRLVMVSCNAATFARDARILREGGYRLNKVLPVDQFVYTPHLEIIAEFAG